MFSAYLLVNFPENPQCRNILQMSLFMSVKKQRVHLPAVLPFVTHLSWQRYIAWRNQRKLKFPSLVRKFDVLGSFFVTDQILFIRLFKAIRPLYFMTPNLAIAYWEEVPTLGKERLLDYFMESTSGRYLRKSLLLQKQQDRKYCKKHFPRCNLFIT